MRTATGYAGERAKRAGNHSRLFRSLVIHHSSLCFLVLLLAASDNVRRPSRDMQDILSA